MLSTTKPEESHWYAVYTRSRHEKKVADALSSKKISAFLPRRRVMRRWKDRRKEIELPLFSGYVFVKTSMREKLSILRTPGVVTIVGDARGPIAIPDQQISGIEKLVASNLKYDPVPYLKEGARVSIVHGPLSGVEGILLEKRKKCRLVLSVDLIQQSTALEIDVADTDVSL